MTDLKPFHMDGINSSHNCFK